MMTMIRKLREAWSMVWAGLRYPYRRRTAWINVAAWTFALVLVMISAAADLITKQYLWLVWMGIVGAFDFVCLHRSIEGLLWRRMMDRWEAVLRTSPGRGSTRE